MVTTDDFDDFDDLAVAARWAVLSSHAKATAVVAGWAKLQPPPWMRPVELAHLLAMIAPGVSELAAAWKPTFQKRRAWLRVSGVFCHKSPLVDLG